MKNLREIFRWDGTIGRMPYAVAGLLGGGLKIHLDRWLAPGNAYWVPFSGEAAELALRDDSYGGWWFLSTIVFLIGAFRLTSWRLRDVGASQFFSAGLLLPWGILFLFGALCLIPGRDERLDSSDRWVAKDLWGAAAASATLAALTTLVLVGLGAVVFEFYGWSLFVGVPFALGLVSTSVFLRGREPSLVAVLATPLAALVCAGGALLAFSLEGVICIVMAAPLGIPAAWLGGVAAYAVARARRDHAQVAAAVVLVMPGAMSIEHRILPPPPAFEVKTALEVEAPPTEVWPHVVEFTELPEPEEWLFRLGIAYPIRAEIVGEGVGAERRCVFSTGAFVEPIEVWEEPRRLEFSVTSNPPPMEEWTPYKEIHAPHLEGFLVSNGGRFLLTPLPGGRTRLEGTTWYRHSLWPSGYWRIISDEIIHRIHLRVLENIRERSESAAAASLQ